MPFYVVTFDCQRACSSLFYTRAIAGLEERARSQDVAEEKMSAVRRAHFYIG